jgi:hypothetical protein
MRKPGVSTFVLAFVLVQGGFSTWVEAAKPRLKKKPQASSWLAPKLIGEAGFRGAAGQESRLSMFGRGYLEPGVSWKPSADSVFQLQLQGRGWYQAEERSGARSERWALEVRDSFLSFETDANRLRVGFQSLSWGETFGFFIADLPNPRDLSDPLLLEIGHIKKPVFMIQDQFFFDGGSVQAFFTPLARHTDFSVSLPRREFARVGNDSEYGLKLNRLFDFGMDASLFVLKHHERSFVLQPRSIWSGGFTATQSFGQDWILRTDQVISDDWRSPDGWRGVVGLDWTTTENLMLSVQGQRDPLNSGASLRMMLRGFDGVLDGWELEAFWFQGIQRNESWVQPKLSYHSRGGFSVSARYDWIESGSLQRGLLSGLAREDRGLLWLTYGF